MLFSIGIQPGDVIFFVIPIVLAIFFYARSAKSDIDRDKFILFILSIISFAVWIIYLLKFFSALINKMLYGGGY